MHINTEVDERCFSFEHEGDVQVPSSFSRLVLSMWWLSHSFQKKTCGSNGNLPQVGTEETSVQITITCNSAIVTFLAWVGDPFKRQVASNKGLKKVTILNHLVVSFERIYSSISTFIPQF